MTADIHFEFDDDSLDEFEPNLDTHRRRLVVLLFDLSGSMGVSRGGVRPVDALNAQIEEWVPQVHQRAAGELRDVEFAVLTFGNRSVRLHGPGGTTEFGEDGTGERWIAGDDDAFMAAGRLKVDRFTAGGTTPLIAALKVALRLGDERAHALAETGVTTGQVRLILFTDGSPNDKSSSREAWPAIVDDLAGRRVQRRTQVLAFGVPESDDKALRALAGDDGYFPLAGFDFGKLLELITVASSADDPYATLREILDEGPA